MNEKMTRNEVFTIEQWGELAGEFRRALPRLTTVEVGQLMRYVSIKMGQDVGTCLSCLALKSEPKSFALTLAMGQVDSYFY